MFPRGASVINLTLLQKCSKNILIYPLDDKAIINSTIYIKGMLLRTVAQLLNFSHLCSQKRLIHTDKLCKSNVKKYHTKASCTETSSTLLFILCFSSSVFGLHMKNILGNDMQTINRKKVSEVQRIRVHFLFQWQSHYKNPHKPRLPKTGCEPAGNYYCCADEIQPNLCQQYSTNVCSSE